MNQLRDNTARAKQIISIFWIMLGLTIVNMGALAWRYFLLTDVQADPDNVDMNMINASDTLIIGINVAHIIIIILSIVFFIMWFRRAYYNVHMLAWHNARYTEGWAAGSWFVPIINLWWPYQIMIDIWRGTQNALKERLGEPQSAAIVGWWWALHLITSFYSNISARIYWNADQNIDSLLSSTKVDFIGEILSISAIIITIILIQRTNNFEKELIVHSETPNDSIFSDNYTPSTENIESKIEL
ncbi:MAG TPA: DUF4328 domain-containing protein [Chitinophagaceae bacterium]|jgi:hypothetical protein|nr:DUF4328 domain-containing protein [Chitinophagaceae bacterium]